MTSFRDAVLGGGYRAVVKPLAFQFDPEMVHDRISYFGMTLGRFGLTRAVTRAMFGYEHPLLATTVAGMQFRNPIGLSAGFDKEGRLIDVIPAVGFGFMEIGSVTGSPSPGNAKPRLWRLPRSRALVVHFGLNSSGSAAVASRLATHPCRIPLFVSLAKANLPAFDGQTTGISDYVTAATNLRDVGAAKVINISCPNTTGGEPFADPAAFDALLTAIDQVGVTQPTFIKLPIHLPWSQLDEVLDVAERHQVTGFICTNLIKDRTQAKILDRQVPAKGGISGKVIWERSNEVLAHVYQRTGARLPLIGVGGVFSADDAYQKIRLGASLVQLITGMIYRGPSLISEIKRGLVARLQRDGFSSVAAAVGADYRPSPSTH
ncbi:MAG: quinone-dependent dihydroorotate dehydrogenase [Candidatus Kerfeldbacteria bacterium]|nr:quinone-dependent dihydroorotate dehydrogenase [Candidatus Kerfeldbacteria bacterium]